MYSLDIGKFFAKEVVAVANKRPQSAITVNVRGMPIKAKKIQKSRPSNVTGAIFP